MKPAIDIVIPTFNGLSLLQKHLPHVIKHSPLVNQIIVVDDDSTDGSFSYLQKIPSVHCIKNSQNLGFTRSVNIGVKHSTADYIVLLNNDVQPQPKYLENSLPFFKRDNVFAVTFAEENSSWPQVRWQRGKLQYTQGQDRHHPRTSLWASGGSSIIRKKLWDKLSGFNEIYSPGYQEDLDLGWRAYQSGFLIIWNPSSKVYHLHEASFNKLNQNFIGVLKQRNELLFHWMNIKDRSLQLSHLQFLLSHTMYHPGYLRIIASALKAFRINNHTTVSISDPEILSKINQIYVP